MAARKLLITTLTAIGITAAVAVPASTANATTMRPNVNTMTYIAKYFFQWQCEEARPGVAVEYGVDITSTTCLYAGELGEWQLFVDNG